ncbi:MAG: DNA methyltransferase [Gemmatimonadaceae bacterium]
MQTLRHAAELLACSNTRDGRRAIARELGFVAAPSPLDADACRRLGIPETVEEAELITGPGALRVLLFSAPSPTSLKALAADIAATLTARTRHVLWLLIGAVSPTGDFVIACWATGARGARVAALVGHCERPVASDAESLCALAAARDGDDLLVHTRWHELLGRESLSRRFYRTLERRVRGLADSLSIGSASDASELALLYVSRLLFLCFLETKGWLDADRGFLSREFDACMTSGGGFHQRVLLPLFFGTLNTPSRKRAARARRMGAIPFLNGGLFARTALERRRSGLRFSDEAFGQLFAELFGAYRFTAREGQELWTEAAIDPEMLGRAFESLMASRERRTSGAFYTPQPLVVHVTDEALVSALVCEHVTDDDMRRALAGEALGADLAAALRTRLRHFTVLDPACGSGAFLVFVLERIGDLHRAAGDTRAMSAIRRDVLASCIHGVDVNPTAVWLCELRLWLSVVIESDEERMSDVTPLPNLDCNIRVGDSLSGEGFTASLSLTGPPLALVRLRSRYARASGPRKRPLRRAIARDERLRAIASLDRELVSLAHARREQLAAQRHADLFGERTSPTVDDRAWMRMRRLRAAILRRERRRIADGGALPFSFPSHFGAAHAVGGFGLIIGNPPWVRLGNIPSGDRAGLRERYEVFRNAAWQPDADSSRTSRSFAGQVDLAALFVERGIALASPAGSVALLVPAKLWRSLAGGGVRRVLATRAALARVEDWSEAPASFDAAVYPSVMIATRSPAPARVHAAVKRGTLDVRWSDNPNALRLEDGDVASPWLLLPPEVRASFDLIRGKGIPLARSPLGQPTLGVKCGCNDAFIVSAEDEGGDLVTVRAGGRVGDVERTMLRPLLRGEGLTTWTPAHTSTMIVWTHLAAGPVMRDLAFGAARWLAPWKRRLSARSDLRGNAPWWTLFRTDGARTEGTRVVWTDFGRVPRATILPAGSPLVPLNSCYVVRCDDATDALTLAALLNGPLAAAWLNAVAEPARGGWHRYLAWTVSLLPLPKDWQRARAQLAPLAERALAGNPPTRDELFVAACRAYRVRAQDVEPLLAWCHRPTTG